MGTVFSISALTSSMVDIWSGVSTNSKESSSSRCHGVSGPKACPGAVWRAEYRRTSSSAISRMALRALDLVLAQSLPPIRLTEGSSPPTYLVTWSSWSLGTYRRSPGWPFFDGAYSMTRYSRVVRFAPVPTVRLVISTKRPTPWWRSEERRVGKDCGERCAQEQLRDEDSGWREGE